VTAPRGTGYLDREPKGTEIEIVTPEGVPLRFTVAGAGDRVWGYFLDMLIIGLGILLVSLVFWWWVSWGILSGTLAGLLLVGVFLVRYFYFVFFEIRRQGATPGKRAARTRVIDRHGRPLTGAQIFVRNITREVEVYLPIAALSAPEAILPGPAGLATLLALGWLVAMALMPLLNRERLRVGDLLAGTIVVKNPHAILLADLSAEPAREKKREEKRRYTFTDEQLDIYGIYELQVLEDVLRNATRANRDALRVICDKILVKIDWPGPRRRVDPRRFLEDFYAAQRTRLERKMLLGRRRESKRG
jgi:uncharacterized RDD family membrane protein YckC